MCDERGRAFSRRGKLQDDFVRPLGVADNIFQRSFPAASAQFMRDVEGCSP